MYMYMENATLALNQKMSCTRSRTGGDEQDHADQGQNRAESAQADGLHLEVWMLRHARGAVKSDRGEEQERQAWDQREHQVPGSPSSALGNGRIHPPSHRVTAMDETAIIAEYSARKNSDQRNPLYSV